MTVRIRLEDGSDDKFRRSDIIESLETVGLDRKRAKMIASEVEKHKGITEHEIKVKIFQKLDSIDSMLADNYMKTKKVHISNESLGIKDHALIPGFLMEYLDIKTGDKIDVIHGDRKLIMAARGIDDSYHKNLHHDQIFLSQRDMKDLKVKQHSRVAICKHE
jgi:hypothetical protein